MGHPFIVSLNFKSHVSHKLLDNIDFDSRSILFIIEKKNHMTVFHICKDIRQKPIQYYNSSSKLSAD